MSKSDIFLTAELGDGIRVRVFSYNDHIEVDIGLRKWAASFTHTSAVPTKKDLIRRTALAHYMR